MREFVGIVFRALVILTVFSSIGLATNALSTKGIPLLYEPPKELVIADVKTPLLDERQAHRYLSDPGTVFIDNRKEEDYLKGHVKGALFLTPESMEEDFVKAQPLITEESRIILYCYGPECDMAEQVAGFLIKLGYKNLMIMNSGYRAWEKAGLPVEASSKKTRKTEGRE
jgi:rhodanese-related sulfurtransferase